MLGVLLLLLRVPLDGTTAKMMRRLTPGEGGGGGIDSAVEDRSSLYASTYLRAEIVAASLPSLI